MTAPSASYDRDRVMQIIRVRCGDALTDAAYNSDSLRRLLLERGYPL
jgi:hypothetical protein